MGVLDKQGAELEQENPDRVGGGVRAVRIDYSVDENADDVGVAVGVGLGRATDQLGMLVVLEAVLEAWYQDVLEYVGFEAIGVFEGGWGWVGHGWRCGGDTGIGCVLAFGGRSCFFELGRSFGG